MHKYINLQLKPNKRLVFTFMKRTRSDLESVLEQTENKLEYYKKLVDNIRSYKIYRADCHVNDCKNCNRPFIEEYGPGEVICVMCEDAYCDNCMPNLKILIKPCKECGEKICENCDDIGCKYDNEFVFVCKYCKD